MAPRTVTYRIDRQNKIPSIEGPWDSFADNAGAPECFREELLGTDVFAAISDEMTVHFYKTLFNQVRLERQSIRLPYRCDGPDVRREMSIAVLPDRDGCLTILSTVLAEVSEIGRPEFINAPLSEIVRCSACNKLKVENQWRDALDAKAEGLLPTTNSGAVPVRYGICPACWATLQGRGQEPGQGPEHGQGQETEKPAVDDVVNES